EALASYEKALAIKPDSQGGLFNRGMLHLRLGQGKEGWEGNEHLWDEKSANTRPTLHVPQWNSDTLDARSVLVHVDKALAVSIQCIRYLVLLGRLTEAVIFLAPNPLVRLFKPLAGRVRLVTEFNPDDKYDFRCALLSLPHRFKTVVSSVTDAVPYLSAEPDSV